MHSYKTAMTARASGLILVLLLQCAQGKDQYPEAVYYWGVGDVASYEAKEILFFAGEAEFREEKLAFQTVNLPQAFPEKAVLVAFLRFSPSVLQKILTASVREDAISAIQERVGHFSSRYGRSIALQLDADCPTRLAGDYVGFVDELKSSSPVDVSITVTASWLAPQMMTVLKASQVPFYTMAPGRDIERWRHAQRDD